MFVRFLFDEAVILLLIDGDTREAEALFNRRVHHEPNTNNNDLKPGLDKDARYYLLKNFVERTWINAVDDHARGNDERVAEASKVLVDNLEAYRQYALSQNPGELYITDPRSRGSTVFSFLDPAPELLKDSLRRLNEGPKKVDLAELDKLPQNERVEHLIDWLDEVKVLQMSEPGGVILTDDPILQRLIAEDVAAGDALLDCIENDTRLTRSVSFGQSFFSSRYLISVKSAAYTAFRVITKLTGRPDLLHRPDEVAALRAHWNDVKHMTQVERWFKILRDDSVEPSQWANAGVWLAGPSQRLSYSLPNRSGTNQGEDKARTKNIPLSREDKKLMVDLCLARANQIEPGITGGRNNREQGHNWRLSLVLSAYRIDAKKALPSVRTVLNAVLDEEEPLVSASMLLERKMAEAFTCLMRAHDRKAIELYVSWLKGTVSGISLSAPACTPLLYLDSRQAESIVNRLLTDGKSGFCIDSIARSSQLWLAGKMVRTPLLYFKAFRKQYTKLLGVKDVVGNVSISSQGNTITIVGTQDRWSKSLMIVDPGDLKEAESAVCRVCDYLANEIAIDGAPEYRFYWSTKRKDEAIKNLILYPNQNYKDIADEARKYGRW